MSGAEPDDADRHPAAATDRDAPAATGQGAPAATDRNAPAATDRDAPAATGQGAAVEEPAITLDCIGQKCPLPVITLARQIRNVWIGEVVRVLADDPAAANDIPAWCRMKEQKYLGSPETNTFVVRRLS